MADKLFLRSEMLLGEDNIGLLSDKHVMLFGLGGVGSYTAEALARGGVGTLTLVDSDTVAESNRNRQLYALSSTVGRLKTEVARERILDINPACRVNIISRFYLPENGDEFFTVRPDYIADAIDTVSAKIDIVVQAKKRGIPMISCMGTGNKLNPLRFRVSDIYKTEICPLCRVMRYELRKREIDSLKVVWSDELPMKPVAEKDGESEKRQTPGSVSFVPPVAGMIMAGEIILDLVGENNEKQLH